MLAEIRAAIEAKNWDAVVVGWSRPLHQEILRLLEARGVVDGDALEYARVLREGFTRDVAGRSVFVVKHDEIAELAVKLHALPSSASDPSARPELLLRGAFASATGGRFDYVTAAELVRHAEEAAPASFPKDRDPFTVGETELALRARIVDGSLEHARASIVARLREGAAPPAEAIGDDVLAALGAPVLFRLPVTDRLFLWVDRAGDLRRLERGRAARIATRLEGAETLEKPALERRVLATDTGRVVREIVRYDRALVFRAVETDPSGHSTVDCAVVASPPASVARELVNAEPRGWSSPPRIARCYSGVDDALACGLGEASVDGQRAQSVSFAVDGARWVKGENLVRAFASPDEARAAFEIWELDVLRAGGEVTDLVIE